MDKNSSEISKLKQTQQHMQSDLQSLENRFSEFGSEKKDFKAKTEAQKKKIEDYQRRIVRLENFNIDLMDEVKQKRKAIDAYTEQVSREIKSVRERMYSEYSASKQTLEAKNRNMMAVISKYQEQLNTKNLEMLNMKQKMDSARETTKQIKDYYETLKRNGFEAGPMQNRRG